MKDRALIALLLSLSLWSGACTHADTPPPPPPQGSGSPGLVTLQPGDTDAMPLPIYPSVQKTGMTKNDVETPKKEKLVHEVLILTTTDAVDLVKKWYVDHLHANMVMDTGTGADKPRTVTLSLTPPSGGSDNVNSVVIQERLGGGAQITLSAFTRGRPPI